MEQSKTDQKLFRAIEKGDKDAVRELLRKGASANARLGPQCHGYSVHSPGCAPAWMNAIDMAEWTPLMDAINRGFTDIVVILLEGGAKIEATDSMGLTSLAHAARAGQPEITRLLLKAGANIRALDAGGRTVLHLAAWQGHNEIIEILLDHGIDVDAPDTSGETALHSAAKIYGHIETVRLFIRRGANVQAATRSGDTAIWSAMINYRPEIVALLREVGVRPSFREAAAIGDVSAGRQWIADGADLNAPIEGYRSPLELACRCGQTEFVQMLVDAGAIVPDNGILCDAARSGAPESVALLLSARNWSQDSLHDALLGSLWEDDSVATASIAQHIQDWEAVVNFAMECPEGSEYLTIYLLRTGRITLKNRELLQEALSTALWAGGSPGNQNAGNVQSLLEFGVNCTNSLPEAVSEGCSPEILRLLLDHGADLNALYKTALESVGRTAMQIACQNNHSDTVRFLVDTGAAVNLEAAAILGEETWFDSWLVATAPSHEDLNLALWRAASNGHTNIVRKLLNAGADPNDLSPCGRNVLWEAVSQGRVDLYQALVDFGAKIEPDAEGFTLLQMAAIHNHIEVAKLLLETDIPLHALDEEGNTALGILQECTGTMSLHG